MGNCLVLHSKTIHVVRPDGKVLEYRNPVKVCQVVSDFSGHRVLETLPKSGEDGSRYLPPEAALKIGHSYYLAPLAPVPKSTTKKPRKKVRFADAPDQATADGVALHGSSEITTTSVTTTTTTTHDSNGGLRIKLVISKRDLMEMVMNGGVSASEELMHRIMSGEKPQGCDDQPEIDDKYNGDGMSETVVKGKTPVLEAIS